MGRPPKPTQLKLLHGETRPSQLNLNEPQPRMLTPDPPEFLQGRALQVWDKTVVELSHMKILTAADGDALAVYCQAVAHYEDAVQLVNASGMLIRGRKAGEVVKNPAMQLVRDQALLVKVMAGQFGLTPSARVGLTGENIETSSAERLLS